MSIPILALSVVAFSCALCLTRKKKRDSQGAYILVNKVTHARLLPTHHAFVYPTISFFLPLRALENGGLNLGLKGCIFGYGRIFGRLTALRTEPYLSHHQGNPISMLTIAEKLKNVIDDHGELSEAWIMTMPAVLGYEGINPLTVYFCYNVHNKLYIVVLEIHSTFGESHLHILRVGQNQETSDAGYEYQWTFLREFHVSPFHDRSGFYTISVKAPQDPPTNGALPAVRVNLREADETGRPGKLKLTATLRATHASPLTTSALLAHLAQYPFTLFLSMPRILYHAWILHYRKRLDVFVRPPPKFANIGDKGTEAWHVRSGQGVKWLKESWVEAWCRRRTEEFLANRAIELKDDLELIKLIPGDPTLPTLTFSGGGNGKKQLEIRFLASKFFVILFIAPSAELALLLGNKSEQAFFPSDDELFLEVFSTTPCATLTATQRYRMETIPGLLHPKCPGLHPLENRQSMRVLQCLRWTDCFERWVFSLTRARIKEGDEPWDKEMWHKASLLQSSRNSSF